MELCLLQLGPAKEFFLAQGSVVKPCYDLSFLHMLAYLLYAEHDNLLHETAKDRNLADGFYPAFVG